MCVGRSHASGKAAKQGSEVQGSRGLSEGGRATDVICLWEDQMTSHPGVSS